MKRKRASVGTFEAALIERFHHTQRDLVRARFVGQSLNALILLDHCRSLIDVSCGLFKTFSLPPYLLFKTPALL